jgi:hypothetical protein
MIINQLLTSDNDDTCQSIGQQPLLPYKKAFESNHFLPRHLPELSLATKPAAIIKTLLPTLPRPPAWVVSTPWRMPATRSSTRSSVIAVNAASGNFSTQNNQFIQDDEKPGTSPRKRRTTAGSPLMNAVKKSDQNTPEAQISAVTSSTIPSDESAAETEVFVPAMLSFDFEEAKQHLIEVDQRFEDLFSRMQCKPFQHLEQVHPFRSEEFFKFA